MASWVVVEFNIIGGEAGGVSYPLIFDPNVDMSTHNFVADSAFLIIDTVDVLPTTIMLNVGALEAGEIPQSAFLNNYRIADTAYDWNLPLMKVRTCYLADGHSAFHIFSSTGMSGRLIIKGDYVRGDDLVMAMVTFDYSSLIDVGDAVNVSERRAKGLQM